MWFAVHSMYPRDYRERISDTRQFNLKLEDRLCLEKLAYDTLIVHTRFMTQRFFAFGNLRRDFAPWLDSCEM